MTRQALFYKAQTLKLTTKTGRTITKGLDNCINIQYK